MPVATRGLRYHLLRRPSTFFSIASLEVTTFPPYATPLATAISVLPSSTGMWPAGNSAPGFCVVDDGTHLDEIAAFTVPNPFAELPYGCYGHVRPHVYQLL